MRFRRRALSAIGILILGVALPLEGGRPSVQIPFKISKTYRFIYRVSFQVPHSDIGKKLSVWIPYPVEDSVQQLLNRKINIPKGLTHRVTQETRYGNRMIYLEGKAPQKPVLLTFEYDLQRAPYTGGKASHYLRSEEYLHADTWVPFHKTIQQLAQDQVQGITKPSRKIRALYNYIVNTMKYDKSGTRWGKGDAVWACSSKRGNCTDFHSLFIGMSRAQHIPARFEIGFPLPSDKRSGKILGYHCWAQAYAEDKKRWIPIDATEAKKTGRIDEYFGTLPANRVHFSQGRDIILNPPQQGEPLNYFIYPHVEVDGTPFSHIQKEFHFKRL